MRSRHHALADSSQRPIGLRHVGTCQERQPINGEYRDHIICDRRTIGWVSSLPTELFDLGVVWFKRERGEGLKSHSKHNGGEASHTRIFLIPSLWSAEQTTKSLRCVSSWGVTNSCCDQVVTISEVIKLWGGGGGAAMIDRSRTRHCISLPPHWCHHQESNYCNAGFPPSPRASVNLHPLRSFSFDGICTSTSVAVVALLASRATARNTVARLSFTHNSHFLS
jgi:hypothetical protein